MIMLLGDIHGEIGVLKFAIASASARGAVALIIVGDVGLFRHNEADFFRVIKNSPIPIYFIDGNHDDCNRWAELKEVTQVYPNEKLFYIPRGSVLELDGRTIAFMGGAASIDKATRLVNNWHWVESENINQEEIDRLRENIKGRQIDIFISHCPPGSVIDQHFNPYDKLRFGVPIDWTDPNQLVIESLWKEMGYPAIYSGHMHRSVRSFRRDVNGIALGSYTILDINELLEI